MLYSDLLKNKQLTALTPIAFVAKFMFKPEKKSFEI